MAIRVSQMISEMDVHAPKFVRGMSVAPWAVRFLSDIPGTLTNMAQEKGFDSVIGFAPGRRKFIVALGPENNKNVLGDKERFRTTGYMFRGPRGSAMSRIRDGLLHSRGKRHTKVRGLLRPVFAAKSQRAHLEQFVSVTEECTNNWQQGGTINLWDEMCLLARRFSGRILIGKESDESLDQLSSKIEEINRFTFSKKTWAIPFNVPGTQYRRMLMAAENVESILLDMISRRRGTTTDEHFDVLSAMVDARFEDGEALTDAQLVGQIMFFYAASFETVATVLTWTNILIAQFPEIARDVVDEIESVCRGGAPTFEQVSELKLLDRVLRESMRLLPPIPALARQATCDCEISGMPVVKHDRVLVSPFVTHRHPDVWKDPLKFDPSRWEKRQPSSWEWLPFSAGARYCVATNYSMTLMKVTLSLMLQRYRLEIARPATIDRSTIIIMRPRQDVIMKVRSTGDRFSATEVSGKLSEMVKINAGISRPLQSPVSPMRKAS